MGYTPAFDSLYTGTLYGKWPTAAVWASLLPLVNAQGEINLSHQAIAGMTGWPPELLLQGITELCQPDSRSRSKAEDGRRLVLLDPERDWGWRVVNISLYRNRAAGLNQAVDGRNAEKVRRYKERHHKTPQDTRGHHGTLETPHSDSDSDSDSDKNPSLRSGVQGVSGSAKPKPARFVPPDFQVPPEIRAKLELELPADFDVDGETAKFRDHEFQAPRSDWSSAWRKWMRTARDQKTFTRKREAKWV